MTSIPRASSRFAYYNKDTASIILTKPREPREDNYRIQGEKKIKKNSGVRGRYNRRAAGDKKTEDLWWSQVMSLRRILA